MNEMQMKMIFWGGIFIRKTCIIHDSDEVYAYRLMNYLKAKAVLPYDFMVFTEKSALLEYLSVNETEVLFTNDEEILFRQKEWKVHKILKLSEEQFGDLDCESLEYHPVFKYQSTENIVKEMLCYCTEGSFYSATGQKETLKGHILGVYSPIGRCHKTTFSLMLANVLGKKYRVLYLNLEEYTGLKEGLLKQSAGSLSEVMYMYRRGFPGLRNRTQDMIEHLGKFDYIPPVECPDDVADILPEEWTTFLGYLLEAMEYDFLVIDIGNLVKKPWYFFEIMDTVFIPEAQDEWGKRKLKEFFDDMKTMGRGILLENSTMINIPEDEDLEKGMVTMEQLEWSTMGSFVRKVVNERGL